ncbi:MAG: trypsin-like peptidase domain-containing protein, partial [candidate division WOR-3 bacterium]
MRLKNILFVILGIVIGVAGFSIYVRLKPRPTYFWSEIPDQDKIRLVGLQEEVSNQRKNAIVIAANKVGPAVVSITVIQTRIVTTEPFYSPFADDFFDQFFRDFFPPRRYKEKIQSLGSGVIISPDGYILTNEHVITNATEIKITLPDGRQFNGRVIGTDAVNDVALLKIDGKDLPYAPLGDSDELIIGEWVIALGNPFGFLLEDTHPTVTVGVVSALHRSIKSRGLRTRE